MYSTNVRTQLVVTPAGVTLNPCWFCDGQQTVYIDDTLMICPVCGGKGRTAQAASESNPYPVDERPVFGAGVTGYELPDVYLISGTNDWTVIQLGITETSDGFTAWVELPDGNEELVTFLNADVTRWGYVPLTEYLAEADQL